MRTVCEVEELRGCSEHLRGKGGRIGLWRGGRAGGRIHDCGGDCGCGGEVEVGEVKVGGCRGRGVGARDAREMRGMITRRGYRAAVTCQMKCRGSKHGHRQ